jgi:hypothetical protein
MFKNSVPVSKKIHLVSIANISWLILSKGKIATLKCALRVKPKLLEAKKKVIHIVTTVL